MPLKNKQLAPPPKTKPMGKNKPKAATKSIAPKKDPADVAKAKTKTIKPVSKIAKTQPKKNKESSPKKQLSKTKPIAKKTTSTPEKLVSTRDKKMVTAKTAKLSSEKNTPNNLNIMQPKNKPILKEPKKVPVENKVAQTPMQPIQDKKRTRSALGPVGFSPYSQQLNEPYMNEAQLKHFQHILNLWKQQLLSGREVITSQMRDDAINFPDPLDRAALEEEHTLEWRAREREHRLIMKIDQGLGHIKQGEYGYCESCGAEIGIERLEARPTATQCIDCKTINELREKHTGIFE